MSKLTKFERRILYGPFWSELCTFKYSLISSYASRLTNGNLDSASDLTQETIYRALDSAKNPAEIDNPISYLNKITKNIWINGWRKYGKFIVASTDEPQENGANKYEVAIESDIQEVLENNEFLNILKNSFGTLSERESLILKMYLKGSDCKEIAESLNEDVKVIRYDLNAVRSKIRFRLQKAFKAFK